LICEEYFGALTEEEEEEVIDIFNKILYQQTLQKIQCRLKEMCSENE
jgi:hypothetical protein